MSQDQSREVTLPRSSSRLAAIDVLRGIALVFVLISHNEIATFDVGGLRNWTLLGLGVSDSADVFACLSGFSLGYVLCRRIAQKGKTSCITWAFKRAITIYLAYAITVSITVLIEDTYSSWGSQLLLLQTQNFTSILVLYLLTVPWVTLLLVLFPSTNIAPFLISLVIYTTQQIPSMRALTHFGFNPLAWQFLMVCAALVGRSVYVRGRLDLPKSKWILATAISILLLGLLLRKVEWISGRMGQRLFDIHQIWGIGKSYWEPLRAIHHVALMYSIFSFLPLSSPGWNKGILRPLRVAGSNSLPVYCTGVVITLLCRKFALAFGIDFLTSLLLNMNAVIIQFLCAEMFDRLRMYLRTPGSGRRTSIETAGEEPAG